MSPAGGAYSVNDKINVTIVVNTEGQAINAVDGIIGFDPSVLQVTGISKSNSIVNLWVQEPSYSNSVGNITFGGVALNPGYSGSGGRVLTISLKAKKIGQGALNFTTASILANDGSGTNVLDAMNGALFNIDSNQLPQTNSAPAPLLNTNSNGAPKITSSTHPDQSKWYPNNNPELSWILPEGIDNVSYLLNEKPSSNPGSTPDGLKNSINFTSVDGGIWYFHIKFRGSGKWGPIAHYKIQINTTPPIIEITRDIDQNDPANPQVAIVFKSANNLSGVEFYQMRIGEGDWFGIDRLLEGQPYKLPMAQISGFRDISLRATDFAGNSTIIKFDVDLIEKIFVKVPEKQGEPLELQGKAKPNKKLAIFILVAEAAKQMLGAQISSLIEEQEPGNYTSEVETTADENGNWQVKLSDLPPIKYILAISLQDYSIMYSKAPAETTEGANWFQEILKRIAKLFDYFVKGVSQGALFIGFIVVLVGLLICLVELFKAGIRKWWHKIKQRRELIATENESSKKLSHLVADIEEEIQFLKSIDRRRRLGPEERYLKKKLEQYLETLKMLSDK